jgi:hypothetical protein
VNHLAARNGSLKIRPPKFTPDEIDSGSAHYPVPTKKKPFCLSPEAFAG